MDQRDFPVITRPCPAPPAIAANQRSQWCEHCRRYVHNLDALTANEQSRLLRREPDACVSYRRRLPTRLTLGLLAASSQAVASEMTAEVPLDDDETEEIVVVLGGIGLRQIEDMFEPSALPEPVDLLVPGLQTRRPAEQP